MPFSAVDFLQALAAGILVGSAYALMCIGLGIIFGAMRVINFAQGDFLMLGMYAAFYLTTGYGGLAFLGPYAGPSSAPLRAGLWVFPWAGFCPALSVPGSPAPRWPRPGAPGLMPKSSSP